MRNPNPAEKKQQMEQRCQNQRRAEVGLQQECDQKYPSDDQVRQHTQGEGFYFLCFFGHRMSEVQDHRQLRELSGLEGKTEQITSATNPALMAITCLRKK